MTETPGVVDRLRQPEYTGENRCLPCTVVNVAIAWSGSLLVGTWLAFVVDTAVALAVAGGLLLAGLAAVWLRGYLVPGTPTLTKRYLPERVLSAFGKAPDDGLVVQPSDRAGDSDLDVEGALLDVGALEPCRGDDYCLTDEFREQWHARIDELGGDTAESGGDAGGGDTDWTRPLSHVGIVAADGDADVELTDGKRSVFALVDGQRVGMWESHPAARADLAAAALLADRLDGWAALEAEDRVRLTGGLRVFLEACPACGGPVTFDTETRESCCTSHEVAAVSCGDCDARLFESPVDPDALAA
jgi:hypothetical protein